MRSALFWVFFCLAFTSPVLAQRGPLVVILLPGTCLRDWRLADAPHLHRLMATGSLAVMNTRTARLIGEGQRETPESAALTLGAGARAAGSLETTTFLSGSLVYPGTGITAAALYERRMAQRPPLARDVDIDWPVLLRNNAGESYDIHLGNLADALSEHGYVIRAGGGRFSRLAAAGGDGTVIASASFRVPPTGCLVWDAGSDAAAADALLGEASDQITRAHGRLLLISPCVGDRDYRLGRRLAPVLEWGEGVPPGLLRSGSTRRAGLVTNTDFAPWAAAYFGLERAAFSVRPFGEAWQAQPASDAVRRVSQLEQQTYRQKGGMQLLPYLALALTAWLLAGTWLAWRGTMPGFWPLAPPALLLALLAADSAAAAFVWAGGLLPVFWLSQRRFGARKTLVGTAMLMVAVLAADMMTGSRLMPRSLLGYSAVEGARYYGIGNEAMGLFIAGTLVAATRLWPETKLRRVGLTLLLAFLALLLGSPWAGAKAGGLLVSAVGFGALGYGLWGGKWSVRVVLTLLALALLLMASVAVGDAVFGTGQHSHMGESVRRVQSGGFAEAGHIIARKAAVEGRLAYHSAWAVLLWVGLVCLIVLGTRKTTGLGARKDQSLRTAGGIAVAACLLLNDAGVVAGALCLALLWSDSLLSLGDKMPLKIGSPGAFAEGGQ